MIFNKLKHWIVGSCGLDDYLAPCAVSSAGPAGHLFKHIESALVASEIGKVEKSVGVYHTHHLDFLEIKTFGHHLRTDEDV